MKAMRIVSAAASLLLTTTVVAQQKPSEVLSLFFHNHLDRILSPIGQPKPVPLPHARVTQLREQFADQFSKAPDTDKPMYQAAVAVCDSVSAAMDERQKAIASLQASRAVHAPSDLGARHLASVRMSISSSRSSLPFWVSAICLVVMDHFADPSNQAMERTAPAVRSHFACLLRLHSGPRALSVAVAHFILVRP
jgi:hypothetical protein